jgi:hypothetical protein
MRHATGLFGSHSHRFKPNQAVEVPSARLGSLPKAGTPIAGKPRRAFRWGCAPDRGRGVTSMTIRDESPDPRPIVSLTITLAPGVSAAHVSELQFAILGQPEVASVIWNELLAGDAAPETDSLTITLTPGIRVTSVIELMQAIRGRSEVGDVKWNVAGASADLRGMRPADQELADQIMWLLGQVAPV